MTLDRAFWNRIGDRSPEDSGGVLVLALHTSVKFIADRLGSESAELASDTFEGVCRWVLEPARYFSRLDETAIGAYFDDPQAAERAMDLLVAQFPLEVGGLKQDLVVEVDVALVAHEPGMPARELYLGAQEAADNIWRTVPKRERTKSLSADW